MTFLKQHISGNRAGWHFSFHAPSPTLLEIYEKEEKYLYFNIILRRCVNKKWLYNTPIVNTKCVSPQVLQAGLKTTGLTCCFLKECPVASRIRDTCSWSPGFAHPRAAVSLLKGADSLCSCLWGPRVSPPIAESEVRASSSLFNNNNRTLCRWSSEKRRGGSRDGRDRASAHRDIHGIDFLSQDWGPYLSLSSIQLKGGP